MTLKKTELNKPHRDFRSVLLAKDLASLVEEKRGKLPVTEEIFKKTRPLIDLKQH